MKMKSLIIMLLSVLAVVFVSCGGGGGTPPAGQNSEKPLVSTEAATLATQTSATLNSSVNSNGQATNAWFEWGTDPNLASSTSTTSQAIGAGTTSQAVSASLTNLNSGTTYYYRPCASSNAGTTKGSIATFTTGTPNAPPTVQTLGSSNITQTTATMNSSVNPNGQASNAWFEWGTDPNLASFTSTASQSLGAGTTSQTVTANLTSLTAGTTYYYRACSSSSAGANKGSITSFTTGTPNAPPTTQTLGATSITTSAATLNGSINPNGQATNAWFEWGTDPTLAVSTSTTQQSVGSGTTSQAVSANLTSLTSGTTYYYRMAASSSAGTTKGSITSFTTGQPNSPPTVQTLGASNITQTTATINGSVNPNGQATTTWFEWGTNPGLANYTSTTSQAIGSGTTSQPVTVNLTGLTAGTTYYCRVRASSSAGTTSNENIASFTTVNSNTAPEVAYLEISPERVLQPTTTGPITLALTDPADIDKVEIAFTTGDFTPLIKTANYKWSVAVEATKLLQNYKSGEPQVFVGYLDTYKGASRITRYNLFLMVRSNLMPDVSIQNLGSNMQISNHMLNIRHDTLFLGGTTSTFSTVWSAIQPTVQNTIGQRDFSALVGQVQAFANRTGGSILAFPNAGFFDLASKGAVHEIGHKWLAFSNQPLLNAQPHWAPGNAADGIEGYSIPGGEGLEFPFHLESGSLSTTTKVCQKPAAREFNELELYKMGLASSFSPVLQFSDQAKANAWLLNTGIVPDCGTSYYVELDIPSKYVTLSDVIASDGPTPPATQTSFTLGTTVLSVGRLLTANEMAYFEYMAARGEGTEPVKVWEGFSTYTSQPFYAATGGRMTLSTRIR